MSTEHQFQVSLSDDFASILNQWRIGENLDDRVKVSLAIGLFSSKMVSAARAAELAGLSYVDFIDILKTQGISWMEYTKEEFDMDNATIAKLLDRENE